MKNIFLLALGVLLLSSCVPNINKEQLKKEIWDTEKAFEKMAAQKGVPEAFFHFADDSAVIVRDNNTIIKGKDSIKMYYEKGDTTDVTVNWSPDFIDVSNCGTMGYTYGKYIWRIKNANGETVEHKGVFHTVWKKQQDNTWKYVWD
jgi:ketosteroid isomerase-like protein